MTLQRAKSISDKNVLFFVRHSIDLDFMLPIMLYACNPIVIFWGDIQRDDFKLKILQENNVRYRFLDGLRKTPVQRISLKLFGYLLPRQAVKYRQRADQHNFDKTMASLRTELDSLPKDNIDIVAFDHTINEYVAQFIEILRRWKSGVEIISLPHGHRIVTNRMTKYKLISAEVEEPDWGIFDRLVVFNEHQSRLYTRIDPSKVSIVPSLRNTREWLDYLAQNQANESWSDRESGEPGEDIKLLIIHNRTESNLNYEEFVRTLKVIGQFGRFDVRLKPHPRRMGDAQRLAEAENISLIKKSITECVRWADLVMFFHSSAVYDALTLGKSTLRANHVSSSRVDPEILKYCQVFDSPDELYWFFKSIKTVEDIPTTKYSPPKWGDLVEKWAKLLN